MSFNKKDPELIRTIILDHYENPQYHIDDNSINTLKNYFSCNVSSPSCIDNLTAYISVKNNKIKDIKFSGIGCAISTSSTDIMCNLLINKSIAQAKNIIDNYLKMIDNEPYDDAILDELFCFANVNKQANRINCAKVGIKAIKNALNKYETAKNK